MLETIQDTMRMTVPYTGEANAQGTLFSLVFLITLSVLIVLYLRNR